MLFFFLFVAVSYLDAGRGFGVVQWTGTSNASVIPGVDYQGVAVYSTKGAYAVLLKNKALVTYGAPGLGGDSSTVAEYLQSNVEAVYSTCCSFAALTTNGTVVTWGEGVVEPFAQSLEGLGKAVQVASNKRAFAILLSSGEIFTLGATAFGGYIPWRLELWMQTEGGARKIFSNQYAFVALLRSGNIVSWGDPSRGGALGTSGLGVWGYKVLIRHVLAAGGRFAALTSDNRTAIWGHGISGVRFVTSFPRAYVSTKNEKAYVLITRNGRVITEGPAEYGGAPNPDVAAYLRDDVNIVVATTGAFAALKKDGTVVSWGSVETGGAGGSDGQVSTSWKAKILVSTQSSFAVLKEDGSLESWGAYTVVPSLGPVDRVVNLVSNSNGFAALLESGKVISWRDKGVGAVDPILDDTKMIKMLVTSPNGFVATYPLPGNTQYPTLAPTSSPTVRGISLGPEDGVIDNYSIQVNQLYTIRSKPDQLVNVKFTAFSLATDAYLEITYGNGTTFRLSGTEGYGRKVASSSILTLQFYREIHGDNSILGFEYWSSNVPINAHKAPVVQHLGPENTSFIKVGPNYKSNEHREWVITFNETQSVQVHFLAFDIENNKYDTVEVFDGPSRFYSRVAVFTGDDGAGAVLTSSSNVLTIVFKSDGSYTGDGFFVQYKAVGQIEWLGYVAPSPIVKLSRQRYSITVPKDQLAQIRFWNEGNNTISLYSDDIRLLSLPGTTITAPTANVSVPQLITAPTANVVVVFEGTGRFQVTVKSVPVYHFHCELNLNTVSHRNFVWSVAAPKHHTVKLTFPKFNLSQEFITYVDILYGVDMPRNDEAPFHNMLPVVRVQADDGHGKSYSPTFEGGLTVSFSTFGSSWNNDMLASVTLAPKPMFLGPGPGEITHSRTFRKNQPLTLNRKEWKIVVAEEKQVEFTLSKLRLNANKAELLDPHGTDEFDIHFPYTYADAGFDSVQVFDGRIADPASLLFSSTGNESNRKVRSSSNVMTIVLHATNQYEVQSTFEPVDPVERSLLGPHSGEFSFVNENPSVSRRQWIIEVPEGEIAQLSFTAFNFTSTNAKPCARLDIYDGPKLTRASRLASLVATEGIGSRISSSENQLTVVFVSSCATNPSTFTAQYTSVSKMNITGSIVDDGAKYSGRHREWRVIAPKGASIAFHIHAPTYVIPAGSVLEIRDGTIHGLKFEYSYENTQLQSWSNMITIVADTCVYCNDEVPPFALNYTVVWNTRYPILPPPVDRIMLDSIQGSFSSTGETADVFRQWVITAPVGQAVKLWFPKFSLLSNLEHDFMRDDYRGSYVELFDGEHLPSKRIALLNRYEGLDQNFTSTSNILVVVFKRNTLQSNSSFVAEYSSIPFNKIQGTVGSVLKDDIRRDRYDMAPDHPKNRVWNIVVPKGYHIQLAVTFFRLEKGHHFYHKRDSIELVTPNSTEIFYGEDEIFQTKVYPTNSLQLKYQCLQSLRKGTGFSINYVAVPTHVDGEATHSPTASFVSLSPTSSSPPPTEPPTNVPDSNVGTFLSAWPYVYALLYYYYLNK
mmetsp:Transcript_12489/g.26770  ORF Transcript_12489/g.26770 Transcript_12489/m.26770 type:complete len:1534 (-) Transcript_12489:1321-5922(-)